VRRGRHGARLKVVSCHPGGILPLRPHATLPALLCALALAGCGSQPAASLPPAAALPDAPPEASPPDGRVVRTAGTAYAPLHDPGVVTAGGRTFAVDRRGNALRVLEGGREGRRVPTCLEPAAVALAGDGSQVAVLCVRERVLELFDARTLRRTGRANAGSGPVQVASDGGRYLYVTDSVGGSVLVSTSSDGSAVDESATPTYDSMVGPETTVLPQEPLDVTAGEYSSATAGGYR